MVFLGHFLASGLPDQATCAGMCCKKYFGLLLVALIGVLPCSRSGERHAYRVDCAVLWLHDQARRHAGFLDFSVSLILCRLMNFVVILCVVCRYWMDPLHYAIEGIVTTQFHGDHSIVSVVGSTEVTTAQTFVAEFYPDWRYESRGYDVMALCLFIIAFRVGTYVSLEYVRHDKR
jgi:hypothetical protein